MPQVVLNQPRVGPLVHQLVTNALLGGRSGASKRLKKKAEDDGAPLPLFLAPGQLKPFVDKHLGDGPLSVIEYVDGDRIVRAYNAELLPAVCDARHRIEIGRGLRLPVSLRSQKGCH